MNLRVSIDEIVDLTLYTSAVFGTFFDGVKPEFDICILIPRCGVTATYIESKICKLLGILPSTYQLEISKEVYQWT